MDQFTPGQVVTVQQAWEMYRHKFGYSELFSVAEDGFSCVGPTAAPTTPTASTAKPTRKPTTMKPTAGKPTRKPTKKPAMKPVKK